MEKKKLGGETSRLDPGDTAFVSAGTRNFHILGTPAKQLSAGANTSKQTISWVLPRDKNVYFILSSVLIGV